MWSLRLPAISARAWPYAGQIFGAKVIVVLPENPNPSKMQAIKAFGADVVLSDTVYDSDPAAIREIVEETGLPVCQRFHRLPVHGRQRHHHAGSPRPAPRRRCVVIFPVGGGRSGLRRIHRRQGVSSLMSEVIGVCSAQAASPYLSWKKGELVDSTMTTFAEGIGVKVTEEIPFRHHVRPLLDDFVSR